LEIIHDIRRLEIVESPTAALFLVQTRQETVVSGTLTWQASTLGTDGPEPKGVIRPSANVEGAMTASQLDLPTNAEERH